jgi:hypothetical protein
MLLGVCLDMNNSKTLRTFLRKGQIILMDKKKHKPFQVCFNLPGNLPFPNMNFGYKGAS